MYHYLIGPAVGGLIGYITNYIAIRMLFRPPQAKYFLVIQIALTPGLQAKEQKRIDGPTGQA